MLTDAGDGEKFTVTYTDPQNLPFDDATVMVRDTGPDGTGGASKGAGLTSGRVGAEEAGASTDGPAGEAEATVVAGVVVGIEDELVKVEVGTAELPTGRFSKLTVLWIGLAGVARPLWPR